jgi:hypothetical protein
MIQSVDDRLRSCGYEQYYNEKRVSGCQCCKICYTPRLHHDSQYVKLHKHHINWCRYDFPKSGKTTDLCALHHKELHQWITDKAIQFCLDKNRKFFEEATREWFLRSKFNKLKTNKGE